MDTNESSRANEEINSARREIERITYEILSLCKERMLLAKKIGILKSKTGLPIEDAETEDQLKKIVMEKSSQMRLSPDFSLRLLDLLIEESKNKQRVIMQEKKGK